MYIDLVSHDFTEFTCQIAVARTSSAVLIEVVRAGILVFFLNLQERLSAFYHGVWCQHVAAVVQAFSRVWLFATPCTTKCQASVSFTISQSLLKLMSIGSVMPSNHRILCHPSPPALNLSQLLGGPEGRPELTPYPSFHSDHHLPISLDPLFTDN